MSKKNITIHVIFIVLLTLLSTQSVYSTVDVYPFSPNAVKSNVFSVKLNDTQANVIQYMDYHYTHFGFNGNLTITIEVNSNIRNFKVSPLSLGLEATVDKNKLTFSLTQVLSDDETPRYLVVQINNFEKLVILGDRPENNPPAMDGEGVFLVTTAPYSADASGAISAQEAIQQAINDASNAGGGIVYVPYGLYSIKENLALQNNVELYLAPGAVIKAIDMRSQYVQNSTLPPAVIIHNVSNAKISGRGEIDGSGYKLMSPPLGFTSQSVNNPRRRVLQLDYAANINLNGIIVKDGTGWTIELMRSDHLLVQNVKVLNHKDVRYKIENDGINSVSSSNTKINQCFVITIDDAFCAKARYTDMDNCEFSNNVSFNWSGGVKAGMQSVADMTNILFRNCDLIHCRRGVAIDTREGMKPITGVEFRDIRVEETNATISGGNFLVEFESKLAPISDIKIIRLKSFENNKIKFHGSYDISGIKFEDLMVQNEIITTGAQLNLERANNIIVDCEFQSGNVISEPDETYRIVNPSFELKSASEVNDGATFKGTPYGWQNTPIGGESFGINNDANEIEGNNVCWYQFSPMPTNFELFQEITGLPAGTYTLHCRLAVDNGKLTTQRLFANNNVQYYGSPSDYSVNIISNENYSFASWIPSTSTPIGLREMMVTVNVSENENLKIGIRTNNIKKDGSIATNNSGWFKVDHFRLKIKKLHDNTGFRKIKENRFQIRNKNGACNISFNEPENSGCITIVSLSGLVVYSEKINKQNMKIQLPKGLYVVKVSLDNQIYNHKIILT